jgi:hypothetical protein
MDRRRRWGIGQLAFAALEITAVSFQAAAQLRAGAPMMNFFSFFTIEANIFAAIVLIVTGIFLLTGRPVDGLTMVRGAATLCMVITGIIYTLLLRDVDVQIPLPWVNAVLHYWMPVVLLLDWVVLRRAPVTFRRAAWWLLIPVGYLAYSLIRGPLADWYPYPFMDPRQHSTGALIANVAVVAVGVAVVAFLLSRLPPGGMLRGPQDGRRDRSRTA